jgi:hypothetical protein
MSAEEDLWMSEDMEDMEEDDERAPRAVRRARLRTARRRQLARQARRPRLARRYEPIGEPIAAQTVGGDLGMDPLMDPQEDPWVDDDLLEAEEDIESALPIVVAGSGSFDDSESEAVDDLFAQVVSPLSASEAESLGNALRAVGRWANNRQLGQLAGAVLPTAGAAIGTVYGGPVGTMIGSKIGERAGQALGGRRPQASSTHTQQGTPPTPVTAQPTQATAPLEPAPVEPGTVTAQPVGDGSQAAAKLLYLVQNPAFLSSLVALTLGSRGQPTVPVGTDDKQVPRGALINAANSLTAQVAQDADALVVDGGSDDSDSYLRDATGQFTCDPAVPEQRAQTLLRLLQEEDESFSAFYDAYDEAEAEDDNDWDSWDQEW